MSFLSPAVVLGRIRGGGLNLSFHADLKYSWVPAWSLAFLGFHPGARPRPLPNNGKVGVRAPGFGRNCHLKGHAEVGGPLRPPSGLGTRRQSGCIFEVWPAPRARESPKKCGGLRPPRFESFPGPPGPARAQKRTPKQIRADCLQVPSRVSRGKCLSLYSTPPPPNEPQRGLASNSH